MTRRAPFFLMLFLLNPIVLISCDSATSALDETEQDDPGSTLKKEMAG